MSEQNSGIGFAVVTGIAIGGVLIMAEELWNTFTKKRRSDAGFVENLEGTRRQNQR